MLKFMKDLFWKFLYTRLGQWLSLRVTGGWCFIRKDDHRFTVTAEENALYYEGEEAAKPDQGISRQRVQWKTWVIFRVPQTPFAARFVVIDIYDGSRMACLGKNFDDVAVGIRVGHEPGIIKIGMWGHGYPGVSRQEMPRGWFLKPEFLARWNEGDEWPFSATLKKFNVQFI